MTTMDWEKLNAYVDRELDASAAAGVAAAIARDPSLAARVATIAKLKASLAEIPAPTDTPIAPGLVASHAGPRANRRRVAIAASLAALVAIGGAGSLVMRSTGEIDAVPAAVAAERGWLTGTRAVSATSVVRVAVDIGASDSLPDLSAADLKLAYLAADPFSDGRRGLFAGYVGPHGCRLGLWIGRSASANAKPAPRDVGDVMVRAWSDDGAVYALMSQGMDPARLDRFATVIAEIVRKGRRMNDDLRLALKSASQAGGACAG